MYKQQKLEGVNYPAKKTKRGFHDDLRVNVVFRDIKIISMINALLITTKMTKEALLSDMVEEYYLKHMKAM